MPKLEHYISQEELKYRLDYNVHSGIFTWKNPYPLNHISKRGDIAGTVSNRRFVIKLKGVLYNRTLLAWVYCHGHLPKGVLYHKNGNKLDDSIENIMERELLEHERIFSKLPRVHKLKKQPTYSIWYNMIKRCYDPTHPRYKEWGGRGIHVCNKWHKFKKFYKWSIKNGYTSGLFLDRENNDKGYGPKNCRYTTAEISICNTKVRSDSTTGYTGVSQTRPGRYESRICVSGKIIILGTFGSVVVAVKERNSHITENNLPHKIQEV